MNQNQVISLTGVLIKDERTDGFTAYIAEFPEAVAQGENTEEAKSNLIEAFQSVMEFKNEEAKDEAESDDFFTFKLALS